MEKLPFLTTPGYLDGPGARERAGLPAGGGPYRVITQLGVLDFDESTKRMMLQAVHPGVKPEAVVAATGFELTLADPVQRTELPTDEQRQILREIDPTGMVIPRR